MRLLADENIPLATVRALRAAGHDVAAIAEDEPGLPDRAVLEHAVSDQRILLTFDRDFGALIYRSRFPVPPGLILLRFVPLTPEEPAQLLLPLTGRPEIVRGSADRAGTGSVFGRGPFPRGRAVLKQRLKPLACAFVWGSWVGPTSPAGRARATFDCRRTLTTCGA